MGKRSLSRGRRRERPERSPDSSEPAAFPWWLFPARICQRGSPRGRLRQVLCPRGYLALLLSTGKAVVLDTEERENGAGSCTSKPRDVELGNVRVCSLACGTSYMLFLSSEGKLYEQVYIAGPHSLQPSLQKSLREKCIIQVSCGKHHSLALSKDGQLFAWGENTHGQLGLEDWCSPQPKPKLVRSLGGSPLALITAGGEHSVALSVSGAVYAWGRNSAGQLGLGHTNSLCCPTFVAALEQQKTVFVSCGEAHTAVLTKDGQVMTFGAGGYGQLGHNSTRNELRPRLVAELFGVRVSQVACGRSHTLAYVPSLGKVYSFGAGEQGQLGTGPECKQLVPLPMELPGSVTCTSEELYKIAAGGNQSVVFCLDKEAEKHPDMKIATVEESMVEKWIAHGNSKKLQKTKNQIEQIFSSVACVNGSFLKQSKDEHFRTCMGLSGLDMWAVRLFFEKLKQKPRVVQQVNNAVVMLLPLLPPCPVSTEAFRVYLIIPELIRIQELSSDSDPVVNLLVEAILNVQIEGQIILESLWANLPKPFFKSLVNIHQQAASRYLQQMMEHQYRENTIYQLKKTVAVLQILYQMNSKASFKIEDCHFYLPELEIFLQNPLRGSTLQHSVQIIATLLKNLTLFPCIFTRQIKCWLHDVDFLLMTKPGILPPHTLPVKREQLVADAWFHLKLKEGSVFQRRLEVIFVGEPGIDSGGLSSEFFTIISRELSCPKANIFRQFEDSGLVWFPSHDPAGNDTFFLIGILLGMALYNACKADFHFPLALYKKLLNMQPTLEDLKELSPTVERNLQFLLDEEDDADIEDWNLYFNVITSQEESVVDLVENGSNIPVLKHNRKQYVDAYVNYVFNVSVKKQFADFFSGFLRGCQTTAWRLFLPEELQAVICGSAEYNWGDLEKNAQYMGYERTDEAINNFWTMFHQLSEELKKNFLAFLTGSNRIPVGGMEHFVIIISDYQPEDPDLFYPVANTCSRILHLPRYSNIKILQEKFLRAIKSYEKFGLQ